MPIKIDEWFLPRRTSNGGTCVETKFTTNTVYVRNNLRPDEGTAEFAHNGWAVFVASFKDPGHDSGIPFGLGDSDNEIIKSMPIKTNEWFIPHHTSDGATCVETKFTDEAVYVRNSHRPDAGTAEFTHEEWNVFVAGVKDGDYDL
jgi:hypothetical protein